MQGIRLERIEMGEAGVRDHRFVFAVELDGASFAITVAVGADARERPDRLWAHAHENLLTILAMAMERARVLAEAYRSIAERASH
jgi:hypothetical protein